MSGKVYTSQRVTSGGILRTIAVGLMGAAISLGDVLENPSPFSASFISALAGIDCVSGYLGTVIGYLITGSFEDKLLYMSALLSVMAVRMMFSRRGGRLSDILSSITAGVGVLGIDLLLCHGVTGVINAIACGIFAAAGSYAMINTQRIIKNREISDITITKTPVGIFSIITVLIIASFVLSGFGVGVFNLGVIFSGIVSCYSALRYKSGGAAISGTACAVGVAVSGGNIILCPVLCIAGAIAGSIDKDKRLFAVGAYALTATVCAMLFTMNNDSMQLMANIFLSGAIALIMPMPQERAGSTLAKLRELDNSHRALFSKRMRFTSNALADLRHTLDITAEALKPGVVNDISWVYDTACDSICKKCRYSMLCWGNEYSDTIKGFMTVTESVRRGEAYNPELFAVRCRERCKNTEKLYNKISSLYDAFINSAREKRRIDDMRRILTVQLAATENMLEEFANNEEYGSKTMTDYNTTAAELLSKAGCEKIETVNVTVGQRGNITVEAYTTKGSFAPAKDICEAFSIGLRRQFDPPTLSHSGGIYKMVMLSKTPYYIETAICQLSKNEGKACGDYFESFTDTKGTAYLILSDGMGSGARARVDSTFAGGMLVRLLKSGMGLCAALEIINTALMVKSEDESFATLDICTVDLYSGDGKIYKAGAAQTYIKSGKRHITVPPSGMPMGVEADSSYTQREIRLQDNDVVIMISDGVEVSENWLFREIENKDTPLEELVKVIADTARFYSRDGKEDDISVVGLRLVRD